MCQSKLLHSPARGWPCFTFSGMQSICQLPSPTDAGLANGGKYTTVHEPTLCKPRNQPSACRVCKDITHRYAL